MELNDFSTWLNATYDFDCFENELFRIALVQTFNFLDGTQIGGIRFFEYHQQPQLSQRILRQYLEQLSMLLKLASESSDTHPVIDGLNLHVFSRSMGELQLKISQLKNQFEGV